MLKRADSSIQWKALLRSPLTSVISETAVSWLGRQISSIWCFHAPFACSIWYAVHRSKGKMDTLAVLTAHNKGCWASSSFAFIMVLTVYSPHNTAGTLFHIDWVIVKWINHWLMGWIWCVFPSESHCAWTKSIQAFLQSNWGAQLKGHSLPLV